MTKSFVDAPFLVSAPGKVIIFGEHSAVYNKPAIAAALSMRTYLLASPNKNSDLVSLEFPDIGLSHSWKINDLPWDIVNKFQTESKPQPTDELIPEVVAALNENLKSLSSPLHHSAAYAFLYLYLSLCHKESQAMVFCVRSTLPIGAGLGSSASISVCLATSLALLGGYIDPATLNVDDITHENDNSNYIEAWSFMGEKCIHGNPSGIDNAVATHGGAIMFQRSKTSTSSLRTFMRNFPSLSMLLTNTRTPRRTADIVGNVARLYKEYQTTTMAILEAISELTKEGYNLMIKPSFGKEDKDKLRELVRMNHGLLVSLGVSHPTLEKIKHISDTSAMGETKLTGAGGGGCAITLLNDDVDEKMLKSVTQQFEKEGFESFETKLGGKGAALFIPGFEKNGESHYSVGKFMDYANREEIEKSLSPDYLSGWKYW